jgi:hypothetical protein
MTMVRPGFAADDLDRPFRTKGNSGIENGAEEGLGVENGHAELPPTL